MARTGKFGRQPRAATSLTNTLVAIARQFQQQRDQNLMDAWQKGGLFEGQKATDALVLAHWKERADGVSKDDPLYDTYQNAVLQTDYSIHESKMTAQYAQGKASDAQMIAFYLGWAKKVPKDSEFYRVLQRDAGQYMRISRANSDAAAKKAAEDKYQSQQADTRKTKEAAGEYMIDTLRRIAQSGRADGGVSALIAGPGSGSDLTDFDPSDPAQMLKLLRLITPSGIRPNGQNTDVVYHDDSGKGVTGQDILAKLKSLDPKFDPSQPLDVSYVTGLLTTQIEGLDARIALAQKTGHLTDAANLQKSKEYVATVNREVAAWPVQQSYTQLRQDFDKVANDPTASPAAVLNAWQSYKAGLTGLANSPSIAADDNLRSRLMAEVNGQDGVPTLNESFTGLANGQFDPTTAKDSANTKAHMDFLQGQIDDVASGKAFWTYGVTKGGVFVPQAGGSEIGAATPDQITAGGANAQQVTVADPAGGNPLTMFVTATPVFATATDPRTGLAIHPSTSNPIAYAYDINKGGKTQTVYGFQTKDQGFVFSENPPWDERLHTTASSTGGNHLEVDLTPVVTGILGGQDPTSGAYKGSIDLYKNQDFGNGFTVQGAAAPKAAGSNGTPGTLVFDPLAAATATSTRNSTGSADPMTDFNSLTLTTLLGDSEGRSVLNNLDKNPAFQTQLSSDAYRYGGYQQDPKTGAWVPGQNADPNKLAQAQRQNDLAANSTALYGQIGSFLSTAAQLWQRQQTGTPFAGGINPTHGPGLRQTSDNSLGSQLATDVVAGTTLFGALGRIFNPGTNQIKPADTSTPSGLTIQTSGVIRTPGVDMAGLQKQLQGIVAGPTSVQTAAAQAGSTAPATGQQAGSTTYQPPQSTTYQPPQSTKIANLPY